MHLNITEPNGVADWVAAVCCLLTWVNGLITGWMANSITRKQ